MITISDCRRIVGQHYRIPKEVMESATRRVSIARPRQMAMALAREMTRASLPKIGAHFGGRDHTTVLSAVRRIRELEKSNPKIQDAMDGFRLAILTLKAERGGACQ